MGWKSILRSVNMAGSKAKDLEAISSGDPKKMIKRAKNKAKGKLLGKIGFWRW